MLIHRVSAYTVEDEQGKIPLDYAEYSRFKYGHRPTAVRFTENLMAAFLREHPLAAVCERSDDLIVSTSPFWFTPPAAYLLSLNFHYLLNEMMVERGQPPVTFLKIHRSRAPVTDFGKLTHRQRLANMKTDRLSFDPFMLKGGRLILVEDARITGAHEGRTIEFMEKSGLKELFFVYVVNVSYGKDDPDIENRINHRWVNDLGALQLLMRRPEEFLLNSRACRLVLSWPNRRELKDFCKRIGDETLFGLYTASVNDGYGTMPEFSKGFQLVRDEARYRHERIRADGAAVLPKLET